jgi:small subunit ribosomal protein S8e
LEEKRTHVGIKSHVKLFGLSQVFPAIPSISAGRPVASKSHGGKRESEYIVLRHHPDAAPWLCSAVTANALLTFFANVKWLDVVDPPHFKWSSHAIAHPPFPPLHLRYELGRQPAMTKLSSNVCVRRLRVRGGNSKFRALRLDSGNFSWGSESVTRKVRILDVVYNASNNELVRTQTLVKNAIVQVDAAPFKQWYQQHYGAEIGAKKRGAAAEPGEEAGKVSNHVQRKLKQRNTNRKLDSHMDDQFAVGRVLACISSRPGQCGRADGYILEGRELEFYVKKMQKKKGKGAA